MSAPSPAEEPWTDHSIMEGMFVRALQPQGAFLEELKALGYDPAWPKTRYPAKLWQDALKVACKHVFPGTPERAAMRKLGERFVAGYAKTILGGVGMAALPFLSAERVLLRLPESTRRVGSYRIEVKKEQPGLWRLIYTGPYLNPDFSVGLMETMFQKLGTVELTTVAPDRFEMLFKEK